jgi:hypothetical protein
MRDIHSFGASEVCGVGKVVEVENLNQVLLNGE